MPPIDVELVKVDWRNRQYSADVWTDPPGQVWADFKHDVDELFMVIEGNVVLEINNETIYPAIGQEIIIPADTLHTVKNIGKTTSRWLYGYKQ